LHTKLKINALLASILVMTGLYTITLRVMSIGAAGGIRSELSLYTGSEAQLRDLLAWLPVSVQQRNALIMAAIAIALTLLLYWLMSSQLGLAMRATGVNEQMARAVGINTDNMKMLLLAVSNGLVAVSGALVAQSNSYTDANVGNTAIVVGLAAVILGEVVIRSAAVGWALIGALLGSIFYRIAVQIAFAQQVQVTDTQLVTALLVIIALALPQIGGQFQRLGQRRSAAAEK
jgi:putative tryptophan/tyrosine transport system permease protein